MYAVNLDYGMRKDLFVKSFYDTIKQLQQQQQQLQLR